MIGCGSDSDNNGRRSHRVVNGDPSLLSYNDCYNVDRNGNGDLEFDFSSAVAGNYYTTYVSDGYNDDGSENVERNDDGVEIISYESNNVLSGYVYIPESVVNIILNDIEESVNDDTLCIHGLNFFRNGIELVLRADFNEFFSIQLVD